MSNPETSTTAPAKLEDLVVLNDEIVALVRAGIPLEMGLKQVGSDLRGSLGRLATVLAARMSQGRSLGEALDMTTGQFPSMYRAIVNAGMKSRRLPSALESLTRFIQSLLEMHRRITLALLYPMIVLLAAYSLFLVMLAEFVPRFREFYHGMHIPMSVSLQMLNAAARTMPYWGPVFPALLVLSTFYWTLVQRRRLLYCDSRFGLLRFVPWAGRITLNLRFASFGDLLATLTENGVPLKEALLLAAEGTGDRRIVCAARRIGDRIQHGATLAETLKDETALPPFLRWLIASGQRQGTLSESLKRSADIYRVRAVHQLELMKVFLPLLLLVVIGGGVTMLYALSLFAPLIEALHGLSMEPGVS